MLEPLQLPLAQSKLKAKKLQAGINSSWICGLREFFKIGAKMRFCLKLALTMDRPVVERGPASFVALPKNRTHCCSSSSPRYTWRDRPSFCIAISGLA